ncbi:MAG: efflux RND transporter periplasmic adaptor subunit [Terracidiphilus sp.]
MNRKIWIAAAVALLIAAGITMNAAHLSHKANAPAPATVSSQEHYVAGPGAVEPVSEDIKVGSELSGKLRDVLVEEGDHVHAGQVVAVLVNADLQAQIQTSAAQVKQREAELRKTTNGARDQERRQAFSSVQESAAVLANAKAEAERHNQLFAEGIVSREDKDRYVREYDVAQAHYEEAMQHHALIDDRPREEDIAASQAALDLARAQLAQAQAVYEKTLIRSPIEGVILRKHHRAGESVSNSSTVPDPIVTIGDNSVLRVRVDVDETEVAKVRVGQAAYVTADAYGTQRFAGRVVRVGNELGRKNIRTDEPTEKVDTKILETLVQLDPGIQLPVGLRVDAYIKTDEDLASNRH